MYVQWSGKLAVSDRTQFGTVRRRAGTLRSLDNVSQNTTGMSHDIRRARLGQLSYEDVTVGVLPLADYGDVEWFPNVSLQPIGQLDMIGSAKCGRKDVRL